jgi:hypothetical protein
MLVKEAFAAVDLSKDYAPAVALGGNNATLSTLINPIITNVLIISGLLAFGTILLAGFTFISASGDKAKTTQAGLMLNYGIIGIVVVVAAFLVTRLMGAILGFKFF